MKKKNRNLWNRMVMLAAVFAMAFFVRTEAVRAEVSGFNDAVKACEAQNLQPEYTETKDGEGKAVRILAVDDTLYVSEKLTRIRKGPGWDCKPIVRAYLGSKLHRTGVCDNGWSRVVYEQKGQESVEGFVCNSYLDDKTQITSFSDTAQVSRETEILDYPARKEGEPVGELEENTEVTCTGMINYIWARILYADAEGKEQVGYVPASSLNIPGMVLPASSASSGTEETGTIHKSSGQGIFAEAVEGVTLEGVKEGTPVAAAADASLQPLGTFRITHYCPCSICCGPWADGITSTGITAMTNHTIAVDPSQIPYGSKVVINGQVYVAEDCGGAIKHNCIDIYVASHEEGENKGVYYTDVYLLLE